MRSPHPLAETLLDVEVRRAVVGPVSQQAHRTLGIGRHREPAVHRRIAADQIGDEGRIDRRVPQQSTPEALERERARGHRQTGGRVHGAEDADLGERMSVDVEGDAVPVGME